jgi:hypothetical protein
MKSKKIALILSLLTLKSWAIDPNVSLKVWTNEAIINVYSFDDKSWASRQKDMAAYFLPSAWKAYLDAINKTNILKLVMQNHMTVSAVATLPPTIKMLDPQTYHAKMPILVSYASTDNTQTQYLTIDLEIIKTSGATTRGFAINRFEAHIDSKPCICSNDSTKNKVTIV